MRRRRSGGMSLFTFIILLVLIDSIFSADPYTLFGLLFVFGFFGALGFGFMKLMETIFSPNSSRYTQSSRVTSKKSTSYVQKSSNVQIDKALNEYFKNNLSLVLFDDVTLSVQGGTYTTLDNLYVNYKDEKICQLRELHSYYPDAYQRIFDALAKVTKKGVVQEEKKNKKKDSKKKEETEVKKEEKKDSFSEAEKYIEQITSLNKDLFNEEVTNGLYQTCDLLRQIDMADREDGKVDPKLNKLYEYYLPILLDILEEYRRLSNSPVKGEDFKKCEVQLVKTIKLINEALKTIYNSLHESDYMNLNADINTLQSLLKQDGLVESPFKGANDD